MRIKSNQEITPPKRLSPKKSEDKEVLSEPQDRVTLNQRPEKEWTLLFYLDGNSNLSRYSLAKFRDLEKVGSDENMNVVAQIYRREEPLKDFITGDWSGARRYYVVQNPEAPNNTYKSFHTHSLYNRARGYVELLRSALSSGKEKGQVPDSISGKLNFLHKAIKYSDYNNLHNILSDTEKFESELVSDQGKLSMNSPESFKDFLTWGMKNYPAKHYMVVVQGHGAGPAGVLAEKDGRMALPEMEQALKEATEETGIKPDILAFDACVMGGAEVAYQMKDTADIMIASQEVERGYTMPYDKITASFRKELKQGSLAPARASEKIVSACKDNYDNYTPTMSAVDLRKMDALALSLDDFSRELSGEEIPEEVMKNILSRTQHFDLKRPGDERYLKNMIPGLAKNFIDLYGFASNIAENPEIKNENLKKAADKLSRVFSETIIASETTGEDYKGAHGMSITFPERHTAGLAGDMKNYRDLSISKDTCWNEFILPKAEKFS